LTPRQANEPRDNGAALVTALFVLLAVMIVGVSAAQGAFNDEKAARTERDRHIAFQAAEAALLDAERDIEGGNNPASARAALFAAGNAIGFDEGCGKGQDNPNLGLCQRAPPPDTPAWQQAALSDQRAANTTPYGKFTGAAMQTGGGALPAREPRYIIELIPLALAGADAGEDAGNFYRITAIGFGARDSTHVVLQSYYRKVEALAGGPG